jgi:hypothetical protein
MARKRYETGLWPLSYIALSWFLYSKSTGVQGILPLSHSTQYKDVVMTGYSVQYPGKMLYTQATENLISMNKCCLNTINFIKSTSISSYLDFINCHLPTTVYLHPWEIWWFCILQVMTLLPIQHSITMAQLHVYLHTCMHAYIHTIDLHNIKHLKYLWNSRQYND